MRAEATFRELREEEILQQNAQCERTKKRREDRLIRMTDSRPNALA